MKVPDREKMRDIVKDLDELDRIVANARTATTGADFVAPPTGPKDPSTEAGDSRVDRNRGFGPPGDVVSVLHIVRLVRDRWLRIAFVVAACLALALLVTEAITPIYESTSVLLVRLGRESIYRAGVGEGNTMVVSKDREALVNAEVEILMSRDLHQSLLQQVGVTALYPDLGDGMSESTLLLAPAARRLRSNIIVRAKPEASVISVSFRHPDPETATEVVGVLVDLFKDKHLKAFSDPRSTLFLEEKVAEYRRELEETEERLNVFQSTNAEVTDQTTRSELLSQRSELMTALKEARSEAAGLAEKIAYLEGLREPGSARSMVDPQRADAIHKANARLLELQLEEKELRGRFTESSRQVVNVREQIHLVEEFLEQHSAQLESDVPRELVDANAERQFQEARARSLQQQLTQLDGEIAETPAKQRQLRDLSRNRDTAEENYQAYSRRLEDARISEEMDREKIANISVIQEADLPTKPIRPNRTVNLVVGLFLGMSLGLGWALLLGPSTPAGSSPDG